MLCFDNFHSFLPKYCSVLSNRLLLQNVLLLNVLHFFLQVAAFTITERVALTVYE